MSTTEVDYFQEAQSEKAKVVQKMFDEVAPRYDQFNQILSLGMDTLWRKKAIARLVQAVPEQGRILDLGCGSGDLANEIHGQRPVFGADFSFQMLKEAHKKSQSINWMQADGSRLPLQDSSFYGLISAFVVRNIENRQRAFNEFFRILKPGGRIAIVEFSMPKFFLIRWGFLAYLNIAFPLACALFGGNQQAYAYLRKSIVQFGDEVDLVEEFNKAGFQSVQRCSLLFGGVCLYEGVKPQSA